MLVRMSDAPKLQHARGSRVIVVATLAALSLTLLISVSMVWSWVDGPYQSVVARCGPGHACPSGSACGYGASGSAWCLCECSSSADCDSDHQCVPGGVGGVPATICRLREVRPTGLRLWLGRKLAAWRGIHDDRYSEY